MENPKHSQTHLFMVRVWVEDLYHREAEWRGQVKHVMSGEVRYFRDWPNLITILQKMLAGQAEAAKDAGPKSTAVINPKSDKKLDDG